MVYPGVLFLSTGFIHRHTPSGSRFGGSWNIQSIHRNTSDGLSDITYYFTLCHHRYGHIYIPNLSQNLTTSYVNGYLANAFGIGDRYIFRR